MIKSRSHAAFFINEPFFEQANERLRLVALNFSMLHGSSSSHFIIDSYCPKSSGAGFDLFGLFAEPEMDVPLEAAGFQGFCGKDNVRVTIVESPIELKRRFLSLEIQFSKSHLFWNRRKLRFLDSPDFNSSLFSSCVDILLARHRLFSFCSNC